MDQRASTASSPPPLSHSPSSSADERSPTLVEFSPTALSPKDAAGRGIGKDHGDDRDDISEEEAIASTLVAALEETVVHSNGEMATATAGAKPRWWVRLLPHKAGGALDQMARVLSVEHYEMWCQNAGMIMISVVSTWIVTRMGGGLTGCLMVGSLLATCYKRSLRRFKRDSRSDLQRELVEQRMLAGNAETADWLNHFVHRFWQIYEPILSAQIIGIADAILIESTPVFLDSIRLSQFTLGNRPFRIDSIKTHPRTEPNVVRMDWAISFSPPNAFDMSPRELQTHVRPKIMLTIRVGKGMLGAGMPVLLEDLEIVGKLRLTLTLSKSYPYIKTVQASFLDKPRLAYALKPVGGETLGFDITKIPGLQSFVQEQVHASLGPMMYAPNVYTLDVAGMMAGTTDIYSANGVLVMTVYSATNLKQSDLFGTVDPYITFHVGNVNNAELARTSMYQDTTSPRWNETHFILLNNLDAKLFMQVMDYNSNIRDSQLGVAQFDLNEVGASPRKAVQGLQLTALRGGRPVGQITCDMQYFPVSKPVHDADGAVTMPAADSNSGVLQLTVHECSGLAGAHVSASALVRVNGRERMRTAVFKRTDHPRWEKSVEIFVADRTTMELSVAIIDNKDFADDEVIGRWNMMLEDLLQQIPIGAGWWGLKDGPGHIHISATWKPIVMTDICSVMAPRKQRNPIGVVRLHVFGAHGLTNVALNGVPDPYVRVLSGTQVRAKTEHCDDDFNPEWNAVLYVPVHSIYDDLVLEVMDFNRFADDQSMGLYDLSVRRLVNQRTTSDGLQLFHDPCDPLEEHAELSSPNRAEQGRGTVHFAASFIPIMQTTEATDDEEPQQPATDLHNAPIKYTDDNQVDLFAYESGVLCVTVNDAKVVERNGKQTTTIDLLLDANDPQFSTTERKGAGHLTFNETGDAFVKELDFSELSVHMRDKDISLGYYKIALREIVRRIMAGNGEDQQFDLIDGRGGSVSLSFRFIPVVHFKLDPKESLENQGVLTVTALSASSLPGVSKSGTSDPFVVFRLDEQEVHKTAVHKKQLDPVFENERFMVPVPNRIDAKLTAEVYDWDHFGKDRLLCKCEIPFSGEHLESFGARNLTFRMLDNADASLKVRLLWQPKLLARRRAGSQFLTATTRMFTSAHGAVFDVGKDVLGSGMSAIKRFGTTSSSLGSIDVGKDVLDAGKDVFDSSMSAIKRFGTNSSPLGSIDVSKEVLGAGRDVFEGSLSAIKRFGTTSSSLSSIDVVGKDVFGSIKRFGTGSTSVAEEVDETSIESASDTVPLQITLVSARNLKAMGKSGTSDPYASVLLNDKNVHKTRSIKKTLFPEWDENLRTRIVKDSSQPANIQIKVKDWNTFTDVDIGECAFNVWDLVQNDTYTYDGWLPLEPEGTGEVHVHVRVMMP